MLLKTVPVLICAIILGASSVEQHWNPEELLPNEDVCGVQHSEDHFIDKQQCLSLPDQSNSTLLRDFPWVAVLLYKSENNDSNFRTCTGTLINDRYVLTLETCTKLNRAPVAVRLGEYDLFNDKDCTGEGSAQECSDPVLDVPVEKVINTHSDENFTGLALLRLKQSLSFTDFIRPICIKQYSFVRLNFGTLLVKTGWSTKVIKERSTAVILPDSDANGVWTLIVLPDDQAQCFDFMGGPVMYPSGNRWHLVGVFKMGGRCGNRQKGLGTYIDIRSNLGWIYRSIEP